MWVRSHFKNSVDWVQRIFPIHLIKSLVHPSGWMMDQEWIRKPSQSPISATSNEQWEKATGCLGHQKGFYYHDLKYSPLWDPLLTSRYIEMFFFVAPMKVYCCAWCWAAFQLKNLFRSTKYCIAHICLRKVASCTFWSLIGCQVWLFPKFVASS